jgi:hypothetical protein
VLERAANPEQLLRNLDNCGTAGTDSGSKSDYSPGSSSEEAKRILVGRNAGEAKQQDQYKGNRSDRSRNGGDGGEDFGSSAFSRDYGEFTLAVRLRR